MYFSVFKHRMTFWPRLAISRSDLGNWFKVKDVFTLRLAPSTEFRSGSCCNNNCLRRPNICKVLPGCLETHPEKPINLQLKDWGLRSGGVGWGREWEWGLGDWDIRYFLRFPGSVPLFSANFRYFRYSRYSPTFSGNFHDLQRFLKIS